MTSHDGDLKQEFAKVEAHEEEELQNQVDLVKRRRRARGTYGADATAWEIAQTHRLDIDTGSFVRYLFFLLLFNVCALSVRDANYGYAYRHLVERTLLSEEFMAQDTTVQQSFEDIESIDGLWMFLEGPFLNHVYNEVFYTGEPMPPQQHRLVLGQSKVIGRVRISQVRVRADGCTVHEAFRNANLSAHIPHCYPVWDLVKSSLHERAPIVGFDAARVCEAQGGEGDVSVLGERLACNGSMPGVRSYPWYDAATTGQGLFVGEHGSYGGGGYFVDLPNAQAAVRTELARMKEDDFFDPAMRAAWIDFTLYNANIHRFMVVRLLVEQLGSGGLHASADMRSLHLLWYYGDAWLAQLVPEALLLLFVVVYVLIEFYEMKKAGRAYLRDPWNWWDWANILCLVAAAVCRYQEFRGMRAILLRLQQAEDSFLNFRSVAVYADLELNLAAAAALMLNLKVLAYLQGVPRLNALLNTLARAKTQLVSFALCFAILMMAFSGAFNLAFGTQLYAWRSVGHSCVSLLHFILGAVDPLPMRHENFVLGPLLYVAFLLFMVLILVNMFLAIIADSYAVESRLVDPNVDVLLVTRQAARRQLARCVAPCGGAGRRLAARLDPPEPPADEAAGGGEADDVLAESFLESAMQGVKQRVLAGHLHVVGDATTQLKAMCFRHDSQVLPLREPLHAVLAQLEELRRVNRQLRMHALQFGWEWDPATRSLVVSRSRRAGMAALQAADGAGGPSPPSRASRRASRISRASRASRAFRDAADAPPTASDRESQEEEEWTDDDELVEEPAGAAAGADALGGCAATVKFAAKGRRRTRNKRSAG